MWKRKVQKYGYHENRNKKRIALTNEQQRGFCVEYMQTVETSNPWRTLLISRNHSQTCHVSGMLVSDFFWLIRTSKRLNVSKICVFIFKYTYILPGNLFFIGKSVLILFEFLFLRFIFLSVNVLPRQICKLFTFCQPYLPNFNAYFA